MSALDDAITAHVKEVTGPTVAEIRCQRCDLKHPPHTYRFELIV